MTPIIFDGRAFAKEKEQELQTKVEKLKVRGITPKLVSIIVGDVDGALKYQEMKKKAGERVGVEVEVQKFSKETETVRLLKVLMVLKKDPSIHGVMIQLPLPKNFSNEEKDELIHAIDPKKDVDGMREDADFVAPVVMAVMESLEIAASTSFPRNDNMKIIVVGAMGFEGRKMVKELVSKGVMVHGLDKENSEVLTMNQELSTADIVISCTGTSGLITGDMIKEGAIVIDVGAPKGDIDFESVAKKASFITPVPGGIGPVTISCLMENVIAAASTY
jgi:methylenetetrahydrofolate dehydrogenase (NADP+) / methenyltetrahydrofolate cyclohydrolase